MNEVWRPINGFELFYEVSNFGRVKSLSNSKGKKEKIIKPFSDRFGYKRVGIYKNKKRYKFFIHRLVAESFLSNPENKPEVNHINGVSKDNNLSNLEWATRSENAIHSYRIPRVSTINL